MKASNCIELQATPFVRRLFRLDDGGVTRCSSPLIPHWGLILLVLARIFCLDALAQSRVFFNPIVRNGADPWITYREGYYYFTYTTGSDVEIRVAPRLTGPDGIGAAPAQTVFFPPAPYHRNIWAPELHFLQDKAYLYYAADDGANANHRVFAAEASGPGPRFQFQLKGKVFDPTADRWAIDGTPLEADDGSLYFIWSGWPGERDGLQNLYIAPMSNPWTLSGPRVLLSTPEHPWESWIQEGPQVLKRQGKVFLVYSANLSWTDQECLGLLVNHDGNYLNPTSWIKLSEPVFQTYTHINGSVFGPGHCSFTQSLDGAEHWMLYHAAVASGSGWNRSIRMQPFSWTADGIPDFGHPIPIGVPLPVPSGDAFTPARFAPPALLADGRVQVAARAPLPLSSNRWSIEVSHDLNSWTALTNLPGQQFSIEVQEHPISSHSFYRVQSGP